MIRGEVLKLHDKLLPLVSLDIKTGNGEFSRIVAIVDTGNDCDLVMRGERLTDLGLKFDQEQTIGVRGVHSDVDAPTCRTDAIWDGERTSVEIVEGNTPTLIGKGLLNNYSVYIEMREQGAVVLKRLPPHSTHAQP